MMPPHDIPSVFTPDNEPYLGLESLLWFDRIICWSLECNGKVANWTRRNGSSLTSLQRAGCQIIPQGISIALSIRELLRQAYLLSAKILLRPLIERAAIISYLDASPDAVHLWESGWRHGKRPSLATMQAGMAEDAKIEEAQRICSVHNHMIHGDPLSCYSNLITLSDGGAAYASSKIVSNPSLCDEIAMESQCYLVVLTGRMSHIFPGRENSKSEDW